ncbi:MAG TPA: hypothetical protein VF322_08490 [Gammaproteobacteria bacterium]
MTLANRTACAVLLVCHSACAAASDLSYTFIDFKVLGNSVDATGIQTSAPGQTVRVDAGDGDGIAVAGGMLLPGRFYLTGEFASSVIDVDGIVQSPLTVAQVSGEFDLVTSTLAIGYQRELSENFDVIAELSYDSVEYDFGSFAGERFDTDGSGVGARVGFRWNPVPPFELFASAKYSPAGAVSLDARELDGETRVSSGVRWYFFEDLGVGIDYESGDASAWTLSMRFSFGNLPW